MRPCFRGTFNARTVVGKTEAEAVDFIVKNTSWRILQVVEPGADGVFRHVEGLCRYLLAEGHRVDLAYSSVRGSDRLRVLVAEIERAGGQTLDLRTGNAPGWSDVSAFRRLRRFIRQAQPQLVHAHSSKAGGLTRSLRFVGVRQPFVYTPNAYYGMGQGAGPKTRFFNAVERALGRIGWTIHVSEDEAEWARVSLGISGPRCRVIFNTVDTHVFTPGTEPDRARLRRDFGWRPDALVLGTVGRLSNQKDPLTLYQARAPVMAAEPRLHLLHVGQGELAGAVDEIVRTAAITDRVRRLDYLADTSGFYRGVDAFISPSRYEGLPIAVLEALAADLPLLLSDGPGNRGFQNLGLSHLHVAPVADVGRWTDLIRGWLRERTGVPSGVEARCNHRSVAEARFSWASGYGRVLELYGDALGAAAAAD